MIPCIAKAKSCKEIPNAIGGHPVESVQTEVVLKRDLKICCHRGSVDMDCSR